MLKNAWIFVPFLGMFAASAAADSTLVKFKGGIGVIPVSSGAGTLNADGTAPNVTPNVVRGVNPPGQIWVIADLKAKVKDGHIKVRGKGLLLGGGNSIGGNANASVFATLICEAAAPFTLRNTDTVNGVPLEPNGDFRIDDALTPAPADCASPVLLIRSVANQSWFAAGIPVIKDENQQNEPQQHQNGNGGHDRDND